MKTKEMIISNCKPFDFNKYSKIDLNSLIVYIIDFLDEKRIPLSFENICVASFLMFPKKFSLLGFDEFPDATRVNRVLLHLRPKYENLAEGNVKTGFILTEKGRVKVESTKYQLKKKSTENEYIETRPKMEKKRIMEIKNSIAYKKYKDEDFEEIEIFEIYGVLHATSYTSRSNIRKFLKQLQIYAKDHDDIDLTGFLKFLKDRFGDYFKGD